AGANRSDTFHMVVGHFVGCGWTAEQIYERLQQFPHGIGGRYLAEGRLSGEISRSAGKYNARALPRFDGWITEAPQPVKEDPELEEIEPEPAPDPGLVRIILPEPASNPEHKDNPSEPTPDPELEETPLAPPPDPTEPTPDDPELEDLEDYLENDEEL